MAERRCLPAEAASYRAAADKLAQAITEYGTAITALDSVLQRDRHRGTGTTP
jgi:hypothetical protein